MINTIINVILFLCLVGVIIRQNKQKKDMSELEEKLKEIDGLVTKVGGETKALLAEMAELNEKIAVLEGPSEELASAKALADGILARLKGVDALVPDIAPEEPAAEETPAEEASAEEPAVETPAEEPAAEEEAPAETSETPEAAEAEEGNTGGGDLPQ